MYRGLALKIMSISAVALLAGCADAGDRGLGPACEANLDKAERALAQAKADNVGRVIDWTKAAGLIAAARSQQQFSEYQEIISRRN